MLSADEARLLLEVESRPLPSPPTLAALLEGVPLPWLKNMGRNFKIEGAKALKPDPAALRKSIHAHVMASLDQMLRDLPKIEQKLLGHVALATTPVPIRDVARPADLQDSYYWE